MKEIIQKDIGVIFRDNVKFTDGVICGEYFRKSNNEVIKLLLVRNYDMYTKDGYASSYGSDDVYQWVTKDFCFFHIGKYKVLKTAFNAVDKSFLFKNNIEAIKWMNC